LPPTSWGGGREKKKFQWKLLNEKIEKKIKGEEKRETKIEEKERHLIIWSESC
jgi:hypothetical protein